MFRWFALACAAAIASAGPAWAAAEVIYQAGGFAVTPPEGWSLQRDPGEGVQLFMRSPDQAASCSVTGLAVPLDRTGATQAEIDANLAAGEGDQILSRELDRGGFTYRNLSGGAIDLRGHKVFFGEADIERAGRKAHAVKLVMIVPGRVINMNCFIDPGQDRNRSVVNDALRSLRANP